jgi:5-formyltetrahydrofolate cyclo-ligase
MPEEVARIAGETIRDLLLGAPIIRPGTVVAGFWPLAGELDPRAIMTALAARGHTLVLPRMAGRRAPLEFRSWAPGDPLVQGPFRVMEPGPDRPLLRPGLVLVPLLAFDRRGHRLGYGAGFYDRTLRALRAGGEGALAVGVAFALQEIDEVPALEHDEPLDAVVTEREVIQVSARPTR